MRKAFLLLLLAVSAGCGTAPAPTPIYLGHVATTSGPDRAVGDMEVKGIRLAIEELARSGQDMVLDRPVVVKHTDARGQLDTLEGQAVRLVTLSRVVALFGGNTTAEVQRLEHTHVPLVTPLGGRFRGFTELIFCTGLSPSAQAYALARFAIMEKGVKTAAILMDERREESRALVEAFERDFQRAFEEKHSKEQYAKPSVMAFGQDTKLAELSLRLDPANVQLILFAGSPKDFEDWHAPAAAAECLVFYGGEEDIVKGNGLKEIYRASAFAIDKELPKTLEFAQKFREAFKAEPDVHAALAYDGIRMLVDALKRTQTPLGEHLLDELRKTQDFPGLTGPVTFGPDRQLRRPIFVGRVVENVFEVVKRYDPQ